MDSHLQTLTNVNTELKILNLKITHLFEQNKKNYTEEIQLHIVEIGCDLAQM